jgi:hypothetical protein
LTAFSPKVTVALKPVSVVIALPRQLRPLRVVSDSLPVSDMTDTTRPSPAPLYFGHTPAKPEQVPDTHAQPSRALTVHGLPTANLYWMSPDDEEDRLVNFLVPNPQLCILFPA